MAYKFNPFTGTFDNAGSSGGDAWSDPVDANIVPDVADTRNVGSYSNYFTNGYFSELLVGRDGPNAGVTLMNGASSNFIITGGNTNPSPSGLINEGYLRTFNVTDGFTFAGASTNSSLNTGTMSIETGNNGGSGNTGDVLLYTGTATGGGVRGKIKLDALMATLPVGTADPAGVDNGDAYYNTSTNQLRVFNGGTWRGITLT